MNGIVDDELRALVKVKIARPDGSTSQEITVWVDTAFNGSLVLPDAIVDSLMLPQQSTAEAILADGKKVELATFGCEIDWFGKSYVSQVTTNASKFGLLGTMLLANRKLIVDYVTKSVTIE
jgi:clan AA aspartic protease